MERRDWVGFPYVGAVEDEEPRPYIQIEVRKIGEPKIESVYALLDTGARDTVFISTVADNLGIKLVDWGRRVQIKIAGREYSAYPERVEIRVEGFNEFIPIDVLFAKDFELTGLLGQETFFCKHKVAFDRANLTAYIARNPIMSFPDFSAPPTF